MREKIAAPVRQMILREVMAGQMRIAEIARLYNVSPSTVSEISLENGFSRLANAKSAALKNNIQKDRRHVAQETAPRQQFFEQGYRGQQGRVALERLEPQHCRWPIDVPQDDGATRLLFCGDAVAEGCPYCAMHRDWSQPQRSVAA